MLCKLGFGAEFWRVGPTVRTGQSHISRAFMCANTRLLYLSPNMSAPSRAHRCPAPWFPPKYWPLPSWLRLTSNQKCPSAFLFSCLSGQIHAHGRRPVWFLGLIEATKKMNLFQQKIFVLILILSGIKILSQAFSHFLSERPNLRPASIFVTAGNHFETTWGLLSTLVYTCLHLCYLGYTCLLFSTFVYTCLHLSTLV